MNGKCMKIVWEMYVKAYKSVCYKFFRWCFAHGYCAERKAVEGSAIMLRNGVCE